MLDRCGRQIDYLRISVTDRCDLRCVYCMPEAGVCPLRHEEILRYEDILRLAGIFASVGVKKMRLTGGEPLARLGLPTLVEGLKAIDGIETVVMTTNGMMLEKALPALSKAGLDGVNISLDTLDEAVFAQITRRSGVEKVIRAIDAACESPVRVKLNCVPTAINASGLAALAEFAAQRQVPLRFIELMPIGEGAEHTGMSEAQVQALLGAMTPVPSKDPREKCRYFRLANGGIVGFISAVSHKFCHTCNRIRLTADGYLKTCLQYNTGAALRPLLTQDDDAIRAAITDAISRKPVEHHFGEVSDNHDETRKMSQIGG